MILERGFIHKNLKGIWGYTFQSIVLRFFDSLPKKVDNLRGLNDHTRGYPV